jgi:hypothetical protein
VPREGLPNLPRLCVPQAQQIVDIPTGDEGAGRRKRHCIDPNIMPKMICAEPGADLPTARPGGIVPQEPQDSLPLGRESLAEPDKESRRDVAHRSAVDKPQPDRMGIAPQQPRAGQRFGIRGGLSNRLFHQVQRLVGRGLRVQWGGNPPSPGLIGTAQHPVGVPGGQMDQSVAVLYGEGDDPSPGSQCVFRARSCLHSRDPRPDRLTIGHRATRRSGIPGRLACVARDESPTATILCDHRGSSVEKAMRHGIGHV